VLQRYVLRELTLTFLLCFVAFSGVIFLGFGLHQFHLNRELGLSFLVQVLPNFLPMVIGFTMPVALLTACTFTYGRMAGDHELDAIRSCGISLGRMVWPAIVLGIVGSMSCLYIYQNWIPESRLNGRKVARNVLQRISSAPSSGVRQIKIGSSHLHFEGVEGGEFRKVVLVKFEGHGAAEILLAESCRFALDPQDGTLVAVLHDCTGERRKLVGDTYKTEAGFFGTVIRPVEVGRSINLAKGIADLTTMDIELMLDVPFATRYTPYDLLCEYHRRFAMAFAPFVFALIGASLGIAIRGRSKLAGLGATTVPVLLLYYPLVMLGNALGQPGTIPPMLAVWLPNLVVSGVALLILWWTLRR